MSAWADDAQQRRLELQAGLEQSDFALKRGSQLQRATAAQSQRSHTHHPGSQTCRCRTACGQRGQGRGSSEPACLSQQPV